MWRLQNIGGDYIINIFEYIGFVIGVLIGIFIVFGIPVMIGVFITNAAGLTGIYWWVLVIIIALMVNTIMGMLFNPVIVGDDNDDEL